MDLAEDAVLISSCFSRAPYQSVYLLSSVLSGRSRSVTGAVQGLSDCHTYPLQQL